MKKIREKIKHAAVKALNGQILLGKCHADCFLKGFSIGLKMSSKSKDQGFFTNKGRFVSRKRAAEIAKFSRQIKPNNGRNFKYLFSCS